MPKISVIIPVYNAEKYLPACLDSVLAQTYKDFEIICVNDGSPDNSDQILSDYESHDKRIRVFVQENQGLSGARNTGLNNAKGEYIFFLDSDDTLPIDAFEILINIAQSTHVPLVASESFQGKSVNNSSRYKISHNPLPDFIKNRHIHSSACNKLYRADILKTHRFINGIYFEDWPFLTILFGQIDSFAMTKKPCYCYRSESVSITRSPFSQKKVDSYLTGVRYVYSFYQKRPDLHQAQKRMAIAIKMMVNKIYKSNDKKLIRYTLNQLDTLFKEGIVHKSYLPLKTLFRLWKMRHVK